jgi:hypothetical protein
MITHAKPQRFAISSKNDPDGRELIWNYRAWYAGNPDYLLTSDAAETELARLQASLPHDKTLSIVDMVARAQHAAELSRLFRAECDENGYSLLTHDERKQPHAKALRASALEKARDAQTLNKEKEK